MLFAEDPEEVLADEEEALEVSFEELEAEAETGGLEFATFGPSVFELDAVVGLAIGVELLLGVGLAGAFGAGGMADALLELLGA